MTCPSASHLISDVLLLMSVECVGLCSFLFAAFSQCLLVCGVCAGGSLQEMFDQYPTVQSAAGLLDSLPEIYETVMYTMLYAPDKVQLVG